MTTILKRQKFKYIVIEEFTEQGLEISSTVDGGRLMQASLVSATSNDGVRETKWKISPLLLLGSLMEDLPPKLIEEISSWLGDLNKELVKSLVDSLWWEALARVEKEPNAHAHEKEPL